MIRLFFPNSFIIAYCITVVIYSNWVCLRNMLKTSFGESF